MVLPRVSVTGSGVALDGGDTRDKISGKGGNDTLLGKGGSTDILRGSPGADHLVGGTGSERFNGQGWQRRVRPGAGQLLNLPVSASARCRRRAS